MRIFLRRTMPPGDENARCVRPRERYRTRISDVEEYLHGRGSTAEGAGEAGTVGAGIQNRKAKTERSRDAPIALNHLTQKESRRWRLVHRSRFVETKKLMNSRRL